MHPQITGIVEEMFAAVASREATALATRAGAMSRIPEQSHHR